MTRNSMLPLKRRALLGSCATVVAGLGIPGIAISQPPAAGVVSTRGSVSVITGLGGNVLAYSSGSGLLLVDSGSADHTPALIEALSGLQGSDNVHTLINTHWHLDQVGGNDWFGSHGARIIAHKKTQLHLSTPYYLFEEDRYKQPLPESAQPAETFYTSGNLALDGETVEYGYLQSAHTDGDSYVRFTNANVIAVGDVVSPERDPGWDWFGGGWIGGRVDALNQLLEMSDEDTAIVPSYGGPFIGRAHVEAERDLMQFMYDTLVDQIRMGFTPEDSLASGVMDNLPRKLQDPYKFLYDAHKGLWAHHNKLEPNIV